MSVKGMKYPVEVLTTAEIKRLFATFRPTMIGDRNRAITAICLYGQLRVSEALDLREDDINWHEGTILVRCGKGGKRRVVAIMPEFLDELVRPWDRCRPHPESEFYFTTRKGRQLEYHNYREALHRAGRKAKIKKRLNTHCLRHSGAMIIAGALRKGRVDMRHIQQQLGHSCLATTAIYISNLDPRETLDAMRGVDWR